MRRSVIWIGFALLLLLLPQLFPSLLAIAVLNQMLIAMVFALSYNMLLGQGGMLSFGHAVYFGLGGFIAVHALLRMENETLAFSVTLLPLCGGLCGLLAALLIGSFSTRRAGTVFAMISLGIGELIAGLSLILVSFFGGEAGIGADRSSGPPFFGNDFAQDVQVYYLAAAWTLVSVLCMYLFTLTPAGRMANAVRDNPIRAECSGYSAQRVRLISFLGAGFFAGIAGGLYALHNELMTDQSLGSAASGNVLLMTYIGGLGVFVGPLIGAALLTLLNAVLSYHTELWQLYLGILFLLTVIFLPRGLSGFALLHRHVWRHGKLRQLRKPYALTALPALGCGVCTVALLETLHGGTGMPDRLFYGAVFGGASLLCFLLWRRTLPQLREAWHVANAAADEEQP